MAVRLASVRGVLAIRRLVLALGLFLAWVPGTSISRGQDGTPLLPGGASSLQETYGDWRVACVVRETERLCSLSQQHSQQNGQRVLAIEIVPSAENAANGTLALPFGLHLSAGVTLTVDDQPIGGALPFSTCLPAGCLVPLALDSQTIERANAGSRLAIGATASNTGAPMSFTLSLEGFAAAMARTRELLQ
ncbi:invasion associated locus B family protein [Chelatococcus sp.]|uniref:invasion associated locus B family protein n=1 Tax=Chelatococcus sp. TaxID=1953771 RepID=UPI0025BF630D|nr:invasion associated locus B family protein [Chelatococcus sp.]